MFRHSYKRQLAVGLALVLAVLGTSGCSGEPETGADTQREESNYLDFAEANAEYQKALESYDIPEGITIAKNLPERENNGSSFERGYGAGVAAGAWNCAWADEYLTRLATPGADSDYALDRFAALLKTDVYAEVFDPNSFGLLVQKAIEAARLGDPGKIRDYLSVTCSAEYTRAPTPAP